MQKKLELERGYQMTNPINKFGTLKDSFAEVIVNENKIFYYYFSIIGRKFFS